MASIVRLPLAGDASAEQAEEGSPNKPAIVFANPESLKGRKNLSLKVSYDDGQTWPVKRVLEPGAAAYSDLAVGPDGSIYCFYERGRGEGNAYRRLTVAKMNLEWLKGGRESK